MSIRSAVLASAALLAACDGGGSSGGSRPLALEVSATPQKLSFSWPQQPSALHYTLYAANGPTGSYVPVQSLLTEPSAEIDIGAAHVDWTNTLYRVEACSSSRCWSSDPTPITALMSDAIGVINSPNPGKAAEFGSVVALSKDGSTLAVSAPYDQALVAGTPDDCDAVAPVNCLPMSGAVYLYTRVAGSWLQTGAFKASNAGEGDRFGEAMALSGDGYTLAVGAWGEDSAATGIASAAAPDTCNGESPAPPCAAESGAVYVFVRSGNSWSQSRYIKASNTGAGDKFGDELAISDDGNTLLVGAMYEDGASYGFDGDPADLCDTAVPPNCNANIGAAYLFSRGPLGWTQDHYVKPTTNDTGFGNMLALSGNGDVAAIAGYDTTKQYGTLQLLTRYGVTWDYGTRLQGNVSGNTYLVPALSRDGSTLALGEPLFNSVGEVTILTTGTGPWSDEKFLHPATLGYAALFGLRVAVSNDGSQIAVGAPGDSNDAAGVSQEPSYTCTPTSTFDCAFLAGAVHLFAYQSSSWTEVAYLKARTNEHFYSDTVKLADAPSADMFGIGLAMTGDGKTLVVGAPRNDSAASGLWADDSDDCEAAAPANCLPDTGSVYLY